MLGELLIGYFAFFPMLGSERALAFANLYSSRSDKRRPFDKRLFGSSGRDHRFD
jgi:hypothetical protein